MPAFSGLPFRRRPWRVRRRVACALVLPDTPRNRQLVEHARGAAVRYRNVGVRIEDNYILTPEGLARITDVPP